MPQLIAESVPQDYNVSKAAVALTKYHPQMPISACVTHALCLQRALSLALKGSKKSMIKRSLAMYVISEVAIHGTQCSTILKCLFLISEK